MTSLISVWAHEYGVPDPTQRAAEIRAANGSVPREAAARCEGARAGSQRATTEARRSLAALRAGWSTPDPQEALARWCHAAADIAHEADRIRANCMTLADAIETAQTKVSRAYQVAWHAIDAMNLRPPLALLTTADEMARIDNERRAIVEVLHSVVQAAGDALDSTAAHVAGLMGHDPRDCLPPDARGPSYRQQRSRRVDAANREMLRHDLSSSVATTHTFAADIERALRRVRHDGYQAQLLTYDASAFSGQGAVAIAVGDVSRAEHVSVLVPGVTNSPSQIGDTVGLAAQLDAATEKAAGDGAHSATVLWFGYDVPISWPHDPHPGWSWNPLTDIKHLESRVGNAAIDSARGIDARDAGAAASGLAGFVHGLRGMMDPSASLTLEGHSYGSTVVSETAATLGPNAGVDDIVLLASPGAGYDVKRAEDYSAVSPDHVYTLAFPHDPVPQGITDDGAELAGLFFNPAMTIAREMLHGPTTGPFGPDPNAEGFDAERIDAPSNVPVDGIVDLGQHALKNYLSGQSLTAVADVAAGRYAQVPLRGDH